LGRIAVRRISKIRKNVKKPRKKESIKEKKLETQTEMKKQPPGVNDNEFYPLVVRWQHCAAYPRFSVSQYSFSSKNDESRRVSDRKVTSGYRSIVRLAPPARIHISWGVSPREDDLDDLALEARGIVICLETAETRLQRLFVLNQVSWGGAPLAPANMNPRR
jgi:hypothetical protein